MAEEHLPRELKPKNSKHTAETKRINALETKWNSIQGKKEIVRKALRNLDRKVIDKEEITNTSAVECNIKQDNHKKFTLFEEHSSEDDFEANFEVKQHLEGTKGLKLLQLKSKLANDDRFKIDERFFGNDEKNQNSLDKLKNDSQQNNKFKDILQNRSLIRYDPTKPDHKILEKNTQKDTTNEKKNKVKKKTEKRKKQKEVKTKTEISKPDVSKEKYYTVTDTLKDSFKKADEKSEFRLSSLFNEKLIEDKKSLNDNTDTIPIKKIKLTQTVSESEDEEVNIDEVPLDIPLIASSEKVLGKCGVWGETFFFKTNDSRFLEAANFYKSTNETQKVDYGKRRTNLRCIIRKKLQNSRRSNKLFRNKLGGKRNRQFKMRLKKIHS